MDPDDAALLHARIASMKAIMRAAPVRSSASSSSISTHEHVIDRPKSTPPLHNQSHALSARPPNRPNSSVGVIQTAADTGSGRHVSSSLDSSKHTAPADAAAAEPANTPVLAPRPQLIPLSASTRPPLQPLIAHPETHSTNTNELLPQRPKVIFFL
jgi:hypothetical protein